MAANAVPMIAISRQCGEWRNKCTDERILCRVDDSTISRMRNRAASMRRAAAMSHNDEIFELLMKAADEAEADAAQLEAELHQQRQPMPPQA